MSDKTLNVNAPKNVILDNTLKLLKVNKLQKVIANNMAMYQRRVIYIKNSNIGILQYRTIEIVNKRYCIFIPYFLYCIFCIAASFLVDAIYEETNFYVT